MNWKKYWTKKAKIKNLSKQVGRTRNGKEKKRINAFLKKYILRQLKLKKSDIC